MTHFEEAIHHYRKGEYDTAISRLSEAIQMEPENAPAYVYRAAVYFETADYDRAISDFTEALRLDAANAAVYHHNRCLAYDAKGDRASAQVDFERAIARGLSAVALYCSRGNAHFQRGEIDRALAIFSEALERDPANSAVYHHNREVVLSQAGEARIV